jgi:hypothetical protein
MNLRDVKALLFQRGWLTLSGAVTVLIVPQTLTRPEQGLFFTFISLAAIQSIFEAGITSVFFNFAAHERAVLHMAPPPSDAVRERAEVRIRQLVEISRRWFLALALLYCVIVGPLGYHFVDIAVRRESLMTHWQGPFFLLVGAISLSLYNLSRVPILEAHGRIADVANFRLRSTVLSAGIMWVGLVSGGGLWALALSYGVQSATMTLQVALAYRQLPLPKFSAALPAARYAINWRAEIVPLQFRLATSYFCGYFIAQAVVPFALHAYGSEVSGQIGLMLSVFNALAAVLASYIYAAAPRYATCIARGDLVPL